MAAAAVGIRGRCKLLTCSGPGWLLRLSALLSVAARGAWATTHWVVTEDGKIQQQVAAPVFHLVRTRPSPGERGCPVPAPCIGALRGPPLPGYHPVGLGPRPPCVRCPHTRRRPRPLVSRSSLAPRGSSQPRPRWGESAPAIGGLALGSMACARGLATTRALEMLFLAPVPRGSGKQVAAPGCARVPGR